MRNKKIIFHVTKKYMKLNRRRTAITFLGILFMVMLMTCVFAGRDTVVKYLENVAELDKGGWHVIAYDIDGEKTAVISGMDETEQIGYSKSLGYANFKQSANSETPYLEIKSYTSNTFDLFNITPIEGRLPENENEIVISENAIEDGSDIMIGDKISSELFSLTITGLNPDILSTIFPFNDIELHYGETIEVSSGFPYFTENDDFREDKVSNGEQVDFIVVGIIQSPYFEKSGGAGYAAFTCMSDDAINNGSVNAVMKLDLDKVDSAYSFIQKLNTIAGKDIKTEANELLLVFSSKGSDSVSDLTIFIEIFFTILIIAASLILIYNVFNMSYSERTKYLGMLSSVGATRRQKRWSIYYEMLYLLISALPLGIILGFVVIFGGMTALKPHIDSLISSVQTGLFPNIPVKLSVSAANLLLIVAMSLITVIISAFIPAIKIGKIGPLESIRGSAVKKKKRYKTKFRFLEHGKAETLLAVSCTGRCRYLTKGIVRSIAVLGILAVVTLYGAGSVITLMEKKLDENDISYDITGYNYYLVNNENDDVRYNEVTAKISGNSAVTAVKTLDMISMRALIDSSHLSDEYTKTFYELMDWYGVSDSDKKLYLQNIISYGASINLIILDDEDYKNVASKCGADMNIVGNSELPSIMLFNHREMSTDDYIFSDSPVNYRYFEVNDLYDVQKGDDISITMSGPNAPVKCEIKFAGFVDNDALKGLYKIKGSWHYGVINRSAYDMLIQAYDSVNTDQYRSLKEHTFLFAVDDTTDKGRGLIKEIAFMCEQSDNTLFFGSYDMLSGMISLKQAIYAIIRILAYCFTVLVSMICLLNMYNSVKGWAMERKRETAVLRSMGMTDRQLDKMHLIENLIILVSGLVISAVFSAGFIILLDRAITNRFGNISLSVPWLMIVLIAVVIGTALIVMTKLCYKTHGNPSIVEEIRSETV